MSEVETATFIREHADMYDRVWPPRSDVARSIPLPSPPLSHADVIAVVVTLTTRSTAIHRRIVEEHVLFNTVLPSLRNTLETGFEYWFYLGQFTAAADKLPACVFGGS